MEPRAFKMRPRLHAPPARPSIWLRALHHLTASYQFTVGTGWFAALPDPALPLFVPPGIRTMPSGTAAAPNRDHWPVRIFAHHCVSPGLNQYQSPDAESFAQR